MTPQPPTAPRPEARRDAQRAFTAHGGHAASRALAAALSAYESRLIRDGVLMSGDRDRDAEDAARRLGDAADLRGDRWRKLLDDENTVWRAYRAAAVGRQATPGSARFDLVRDRDLLLRFITGQPVTAP